MTSPREASEWRRWLASAVADIESAETLLAHFASNSNAVCTLAQQAAEKGLKALLVNSGRRVPRTHDLIELRSLNGERFAPDMLTDVQLAWLSSWQTRGRYPGDWPEATPADATEAVARARLIVDESARLLDVEGDDR